MVRVEIKQSHITKPCPCNGGHTAKHCIAIKGMYATPQTELCLCDECFKELKNAISQSE